MGHGVDGLMHALVITKLSSPSEDGISFCSYRKTEAANGPSDITLYLTPSQSSETCLFYKLILTNLFILPLSPMPTAQEPHTLNILTNTEFTQSLAKRCYQASRITCLAEKPGITELSLTLVCSTSKQWYCNRCYIWCLLVQIDLLRRY